MKKTKTSGKKTSQQASKQEEKSSESKENSDKVASLDDEEQGFGGWLRSENGMETMKLFVIANSIVFLTTLAYPHIQAVVEIVSEMIYGPDAWYPMEVSY